MNRATISFAQNADPIATAFETNLLPRDGEVYLIEGALPVTNADQAFTHLIDSIDWRHEQASLFGRKIPLPRLTAWYGDHGYSYSGIDHEPEPFTPDLLVLKRSIERLTCASFNSVLINLYRNGQDSMGWHSDDEPSLGSEPEIASLSLGATRRFHLKHRTVDARLSFDLPHGSCLIMRGRCQSAWRHQLPKTKKTVGARINLTFRRIVA
jgi:alkylated DNA repair dioxygenase AlkB